MPSLSAVLNRHKWPVIILLVVWGSYFIVLFSRLLELRPDGFWVGIPSVWSDWALHIGMVNIFAHKSPTDWFAYHPIFAGGKFTYPFLTNLISGLLVRTGIPLIPALALPSILYALVLLLGMYSLYYLTLNSRWQAVGAITLFLLSSGMGGWRVLQHHQLSDYLLGNFSSFYQYDWYTGNVIDGMLVPQRAFLLGMTLAVWALVGLFYVLLRPKLLVVYQRRILLLAGILTGLLPIAHAHSFIALLVIVGTLTLTGSIPWRQLIVYAVPAGLLSIFLYLHFIAGGIENSHFTSWLPGWTAKGGLLGWIRQWWLQWGVMIPVAIAGFIVLHRKALRITQAYYVSFLLIFILANFVLFQPVRWDNSKLFLWVYFGCAGLASALLSQLWQERVSGKLLTITLVFLLCFTGILEVTRLQVLMYHKFQLNSEEEIRLAEQIRTTTGPNDRFLTAPVHNHFIMVWAARPLVLGYIPWVLNYGFNYAQREADVHSIYAGDDTAEKLLKQYKVSYVVIGSPELHTLTVNEQYFIARFPVAYSSQNYRIYDTRILL